MTKVVPADLPAACQSLGQLLDGCPALELLQLNIKQVSSSNSCHSLDPQAIIV